MVLLGHLGRKERRARALALLAAVGLADRVDHYPTELSGGQQQRVAVARALANDPEILIGDEMTGDLDSKTGSSILKLMRQINRHSGTTFVFSTHDRKVMNMADRLVRIADGEITALGMRSGDQWVFVNDRRPKGDVDPEV